MAFVIIASPRTGSTHLTLLLHKQADIICHGEIFHPKMKNPLKRWESGDRVSDSASEMLELRKSNPRKFLKRLFENDHGGKQVGFKIFNGHNDEILDEVIANDAVRKVVLFRQNILAVYSSSRIAHEVGERLLTTPRASQPLVKFETDQFVKYCRRYSAFYRGVLEKLQSLRQPFHFFAYEGINDPTLFGAMLSFIGADPRKAKLDAASIKQNSSELLKRFSNPEIVDGFLRQRGLMHWLHEGEISLAPFQEEGASDHNVEGPRAQEQAAADI